MARTATRTAMLALAMLLAGLATAKAQTYPPPGHMMIFADRTADRLEYFRTRAAREGRIAEAVDLTWQLRARISDVWGAHQTILWTVYMDVVDLWRGAREFDRALAALDRLEHDLAAFHWFDDYERARIRLAQAYLHIDDAHPALAERSFRAYLDFYDSSGRPDGPVAAKTYRDFADVLRAIGKPAEAESLRRRAAKAESG